VISVEVIFPGGQRRTIHPHNATVNVDLGGSTTATSAQTQPATAAATAVNAAEHEQVSADSPEVLYRPSEPVYPRLAEQMKIEGSVTLQVNIDKTGNIVGTQVLSGPQFWPPPLKKRFDSGAFGRVTKMAQPSIRKLMSW